MAKKEGIGLGGREERLKSPARVATVCIIIPASLEKGNHGTHIKTVIT